jgi:hypothetical protein
MTCAALSSRFLQNIARTLADIAFAFCTGVTWLSLTAATCFGQAIGSSQPGQGVFGEGSSPLATADPATGVAPSGCN